MRQWLFFSLNQRYEMIGLRKSVYWMEPFSGKLCGPLATC